MPRSFATIVRASLGSICACAMMTLALSGLTGCGSGNKSKETDSGNSVTGKVTLDGKAVLGDVIFMTKDKKEFVAPIGSDGTYNATNLPRGDMQVAVRSPVPPPAPPKGSEPPQGLPDAGAYAPARYATPQSSGLTFTVTGGNQKYDIPLKP